MTRRKRHKPRRGLTIVAVLVCLFVVMLLGTALLKIALAHRDSNRDFERRLQAEWLVESGLERARARLAENRGYSGETWPLAAADLGLPESGSAAGVVTISVDRALGPTARVRVRVQADYPRDGPRHARHTEERFIELEPKKAGATP